MKQQKIENKIIIKYTQNNYKSHSNDQPSKISFDDTTFFCCYKKMQPKIGFYKYSEQYNQFTLINLSNGTETKFKLPEEFKKDVKISLLSHQDSNYIIGHSKQINLYTQSTNNNDYELILQKTIQFNLPDRLVQETAKDRKKRGNYSTCEMLTMIYKPDPISKLFFTKESWITISRRGLIFKFNNTNINNNQVINHNYECKDYFPNSLVVFDKMSEKIIYGYFNTIRIIDSTSWTSHEIPFKKNIDSLDSNNGYVVCGNMQNHCLWIIDLKTNNMKSFRIETGYNIKQLLLKNNCPVAVLVKKPLDYFIGLLHNNDINCNSIENFYHKAENNSNITHHTIWNSKNDPENIFLSDKNDSIILSLKNRCVTIINGGDCTIKSNVNHFLYYTKSWLTNILSSIIAYITNFARSIIPFAHSEPERPQTLSELRQQIHIERCKAEVERYEKNRGYTNTFLNRYTNGLIALIILYKLYKNNFIPFLTHS
jgi:hypothetical protein